MEQTTNRDAVRDEDGPTAWRSVGALAGSWADRITVVRMARTSGEDIAHLAARPVLAAE